MRNAEEGRHERLKKSETEKKRFDKNDEMRKMENEETGGKGKMRK